MDSTVPLDIPPISSPSDLEIDQSFTKSNNTTSNHSSSNNKRKRKEEADDLVDENGRELIPKQQRLMNYTPEELRNRKKHRGSTLSIFDRMKFLREINVVNLNLTAVERIVWDHNPHIQQVFANRTIRQREFIQVHRPLNRSDRIVRFTDTETEKATPTTKYQRRMGEAKTVEHWGQRKLLMSEIEFLTEYGSPGCTIVYAGAAPGTHTNYLSAELFPEYNWVLVDPASFDACETDCNHQKISSDLPQAGGKKIKIINDYFTDGLADSFKGQDILFICDIRSMDSDMPDSVKEERVQIDMLAQMQWVKSMQPVASMLKFRLPYVLGETPYLDGLIYLPVWGGRTTSESRLVVTRDMLSQPIRTYSNSWYEDLMFHYNTVTRTTYFEHDILAEGIDHCYDCAAEIYILQQYLIKRTGGINLDQHKNLNWTISGLSYNLSRTISLTGRTLVVGSTIEIEDTEDDSTNSNNIQVASPYDKYRQYTNSQQHHQQSQQRRQHFQPNQQHRRSASNSSQPKNHHY